MCCGPPGSERLSSVPLTIGKVASLAKVSTDTLRYYERERLIEPAAKSEGGYRLYGPDALRRIRLLRTNRFRHSGRASVASESRNLTPGLWLWIGFAASRRPGMTPDRIRTLELLGYARQLQDAERPRHLASPRSASSAHWRQARAISSRVFRVSAGTCRAIRSHSSTYFRYTAGRCMTGPHRLSRAGGPTPVRV